MAEYPSNSYKAKKEELEVKKPEKRKPVVSTNATIKKKSFVKKIFNAFVDRDVENIGSYILTDVIVPAIKGVISDSVNSLLYPDGKKKSSGPSTTRVSYGSYYGEGPVRKQATARSEYDFSELLFPTRADAEAVLDAMNDIISQYEMVSVADMYDLANVPMTNYAANKYGWTDIAGCRAVRERDGYVLKLSPAVPLN